MTREVWAREHLVSYLAGGLSTEERFEIQERLKTDADLAAALDELRGLDDRMRTLFAAAKPSAALEDRVIQAMRRKDTTAVRGGGKKWPVAWIAVAAALLLFVGLVGVAAIGDSGSLRMSVFSNQVFLSKEAFDEVDRKTRGYSEPESVEVDFAGGTNLGYGRPNADPSVMADELSRRLADGLVDDSDSMRAASPNMNRNLNVHNIVSGLQPAGSLTPDLNTPVKSSSFDFGKDSKGKQSPPEKVGKVYIVGNEATDDRVIRRAVGVDPSKYYKLYSEQKGQTGGFAGSSGSGALGGGALGGALGGAGGGAPAAGGPPSGWAFGQGSGGSEPATPPATVPAPPQPVYPTASPLPVRTSSPASGNGTPLDGDGPNYLQNAPGNIPPSPAYQPADAFKKLADGLTPEKRDELFDRERKQILIGRPDPLERAIESLGDSSKKPTAEFDRVEAEKVIRDRAKKQSEGGRATDEENHLNMLDSTSAIYPLPRIAESNLEKLGIFEKDKQKAGDGLSEQDKKALALSQAGGKDGADKKEPAAKTEPKQADPKPPEAKQPETKTPDPKPSAPRRIIIRSGEIEFEVDSFDQAVGIITKLIGQTKGGVVATTNSDQLANGKMRGVVVVRMPPEELDDFVAAMRRDLGKFGELKNQRIGSQDVTKQYTDMESELRGLRVSEERLIVMMKDAKATLKDLLAVETQLANTRTKLEKIEGELRYYSNLAAMSTLTISLNEKEIRTASGVVESERVQAGIEAEDVDKAFQEAKAAIDELKGRVFRSELKQSAAGQFNAILQFEVAPESAGLMRDRLKQIGVVARLEIDRVQKTTGGGSANRDSKVKRGDTEFFVSIYNLANVTPRETINATVVGSDVPASYRAIRDLVAKLKGNLRNTSLQNTDARNVSAVLDFDIRRVDEPAVQAALAAAGDFLSRRVERSAESENVTDTKVRFALRLVSVGTITARETNTLSLAALDVPASFRKVRDAVLKAKGHIRVANLQETDKANITATLDFDVPRADEGALHAVLTEAGEILSRRVDRRPEGETVTDAKVGFSVGMVSVASIPARETTTLEIAATDVPAAFAKLREAGAEVKAQVRTANLQELDRQDMSAILEFDVLRGDEKAMLAALAAAGEQLARQVDRQASGAGVTDAKVLFKVRLVSTTAIEPREIHVLAIEVDKVEEKLKTFQALVKEVGGRVAFGPEVGQKANGRVVARAIYIVPLAAAPGIVDDVKKSGIVRVQQEAKNPKAPEGKLALARIEVTLSNADLLVPGYEGFMAQLRSGVSVSLRALATTASFLIAAILFIGPWVLIVWVIYRVARRMFGAPTVAAAPIVAEKV